MADKKLQQHDSDATLRCGEPEATPYAQAADARYLPPDIVRDAVACAAIDRQNGALIPHADIYRAVCNDLHIS